MTRAEFAQKIKQKYPEYQSLPDEELTDRVLKKYPEYLKVVESAPTPAPVQAGTLPGPAAPGIRAAPEATGPILRTAPVRVQGTGEVPPGTREPDSGFFPAARTTGVIRMPTRGERVRADIPDLLKGIPYGIAQAVTGGKFAPEARAPRTRAGEVGAKIGRGGPVAALAAGAIAAPVATLGAVAGMAGTQALTQRGILPLVKKLQQKMQGKDVKYAVTELREVVPEGFETPADIAEFILYGTAGIAGGAAGAKYAPRVMGELNGIRFRLLKALGVKQETGLQPAPPLTFEQLQALGKKGIPWRKYVTREQWNAELARRIVPESPVSPEPTAPVKPVAPEPGSTLGPGRPVETPARPVAPVPRLPSPETPALVPVRTGEGVAQRGVLGAGMPPEPRRPERPVELAPEERKGMYRDINIMAREKGLSRDKLTEIKQQIAGKDSLTKMTGDELTAVLDTVSRRFDFADAVSNRLYQEEAAARQKTAANPVLKPVLDTAVKENMRRGKKLADKFNQRYKQGKPMLGTAQQLKDIRYVFQDLQAVSDAQGGQVPVYRMYREISRAGRRAEVDGAGYIEKYIGEGAVPLEKASQPGFASEVDKYLDTLPAERTEANFPDPDVRRQGEAIAKVYKEFEPKVQFVRFMDWYNGKDLPPKATIEQMNELKGILENQGPEAVKQFLKETQPTWGVRQAYVHYDSHNRPVEVIGDRQKHLPVSKGATKVRGKAAKLEAQERNVFERTNSYINTMLRLEQVAPYEKPYVQMLDELGLDKYGHKGRTSSVEMMRDWFDLKKGFPIRLGWLGRQMQTVKSLFMTRVLARPKWGIRNLFQNPWGKTTQLPVLPTLPKTLAPDVFVKQLSPENETYFKEFVSERKRMSEELLNRTMSELPSKERLPGIRRLLRRWVDIMMGTDEFNRRVSFRIDVNQTLKYGKEFLDGKIPYDKFATQTGFYHLQPVEKQAVMERMQAGDLNGAAQLIGEHSTDNVHWVYERSERSLAEMTPDGVIIGELMTWSKGRWQQMLHAVRQTRYGSAGEKWAGTKYLLKGLVVGLLADQMLQTVIGRSKYEDYGYGSLLWVPGGPSMAKAQEMGKLFSDMYYTALEPDEKKREAGILKIINSMEFLGRGFVFPYEIMLNMAEAVGGYSRLKPVHAAVRKMLKDDAGLVEIKRGYIKGMQHFLFGGADEVPKLPGPPVGPVRPRLVRPKVQRPKYRRTERETETVPETEQ